MGRWTSRNNVNPMVTRVGGSHCGSNALFMSKSGGRNFEGSRKNGGFNTNQYPYVCMAYKIPPSTRAHMLIKVSSKNDNRGGWYSITMTATEKPGYRKVATWNKDVNGNDVCDRVQGVTARTRGVPAG